MNKLTVAALLLLTSTVTTYGMHTPLLTQEGSIVGTFTYEDDIRTRFWRLLEEFDALTEVAQWTRSCQERKIALLENFGTLKISASYFAPDTACAIAHQIRYVARLGLTIEEELGLS